MINSRRTATILATTCLAGVLLRGVVDGTTVDWWPALRLTHVVSLQGSFVGSQSVYADSERVFAGSYQGDLFVLERNREHGFPLIQTLHIGSPLAAVTGDSTNVYVATRSGTLYVFPKTWPLQAFGSASLSAAGLGNLGMTGNTLYASTGQASMAVSSSHVYLSTLNAGDAALDASTMTSFGRQVAPGVTNIFDRPSLQLMGAVPNLSNGQVTINIWSNLMFLTTAGCCGTGIAVYETDTMRQKQFINRTTNTVAGVLSKGTPLLIGGSEAGAVDLYADDGNGYRLVDSADLCRLTGFHRPEDIEIRSVWADGNDNLIFAGSSWGNDQTRGPALPSLFILELIDRQRNPVRRPDWPGRTP